MTHRERLISEGQKLLLDAMLRAPSGIASIDDATADLAEVFVDGGKWRGRVPRGLAEDGIAERIAVGVSRRPARRKGFTALWRLTDRKKALARRNTLTGLLQWEKRQPTLFSESTAQAGDTAGLHQ